MDSKLRALKVVDLKDILTRANVSIPAKANKPDLIAKISSSPAALAVFNEIQGGGAKASGASTPRPAPPAAVASPAKVELELENPATETEGEKDFLSPPEPFDWSASAEPASAKPTSKSATKKPTSSTAASTIAASSSTATPAAQAVSDTNTAAVAAAEDEEAAKRRARAERFGISVVSPPPATPQSKPAANAKGAKGAKKAVATTNGASGKKTPIKAGPVIDDPEKLNSRAARFGIDVKTNTAKTPVTGQKRSAPAEDVDAEELERRRKRLERFGTGTKA